MSNWTGVLAQESRALVSLAEDPGLIQSTHMARYNYLPLPFLVSTGPGHTRGVHPYTQAKHSCIENNKNYPLHKEEIMSNSFTTFFFYMLASFNLYTYILILK